MPEDINTAIELVRKASQIVKKANISARAEKFLRLAEANLRHPAPILMHDLPSPWPDDIDPGNVFVTLDELCDVSGWSKTMIRKLANGGFLAQHHRGLYRLKDLLRAAEDFYKSERKW